MICSEGYLELGQNVDVESVSLPPLRVASIHVVATGEDHLEDLLQVGAIDEEAAHVLNVVHPVLDVRNSVGEPCLKEI